VAPNILPDLYRIFREEETYSVRTRSRAIEIFNTIATMICAMSETDKSLSKDLLGPILPPFTEALVVALRVADDSHHTDAGLKTEVLKALSVLMKGSPKLMTPFLGHVIPPVWSTLTDAARKYVADVVNQSNEEDEEVVDSDGQVLGFENLVFSIFDIVHVLMEVPK